MIKIGTITGKFRKFTLFPQFEYLKNVKSTVRGYCLSVDFLFWRKGFYILKHT